MSDGAPAEGFNGWEIEIVVHHSTLTEAEAKAWDSWLEELERTVPFRSFTVTTRSER